MRPLRTCSEGARLITERLTSDAKFQRPHSAAGPDLARLMLAASNLREAIPNRPPATDDRLGRTVIVSMYGRDERQPGDPGRDRAAGREEVRRASHVLAKSEADADHKAGVGQQDEVIEPRKRDLHGCWGG